MRRPLHGRSDIIDLLDSTLRWRPGARLSARDALRHQVWPPNVSLEAGISPEVAAPLGVDTSGVPPLPPLVPSEDDSLLTMTTLRGDEQWPCSCRGACGRPECRKKKNQYCYLRKHNWCPSRLQICSGFADPLSRLGRCTACMEAEPTSSTSSGPGATPGKRRRTDSR